MKTRMFLPVSAVVLACLFATAARGASVVWSAAQGGNGHSYEVVLDGAASWSAARALASASGGYLATETSAAEQQFIDAALVGSNAPTGQYWIGLSEVNGAPFGWDNGEPFVFTHWDAGEPNDFQGAEHHGAILWTRGEGVDFARRGTWNDLPDAGYAEGEHPGHPDLVRAGFVVERDAAPTVIPLPPAAWQFLFSGALAFACWRRASRCH